MASLTRFSIVGSATFIVMAEKYAVELVMRRKMARLLGGPFWWSAPSLRVQAKTEPKEWGRGTSIVVEEHRRPILECQTRKTDAKKRGCAVSHDTY